MFQRAPEAMARAAGTAFRLFAGTDSLNLGLTASHTASLDPADSQVHTHARIATAMTLTPKLGQNKHKHTFSSSIDVAFT